MAEDVGGIQASIAVDDFGLDQKLARLRSSIQQLGAEMQVLHRQMQQGTGDTKAMAVPLDALSSANAQFTDRLATMATATHLVHTGMDGVGKASSSAATALGAGAGLAGGLSVATVAANQLINRWDDLADTFRESKTFTAAEGMDKLGKATSRTAEETARINKLRREPQQAPAPRDVAHASASRALDPEAFVNPIAGGEEGHRNRTPMASLQDRLAHLAQVEQSGGGSLGGPADMQSNRAAAGDDPQLRKLEDINKTLEELRKLYAGTKTIGVKRRR